MNNPIIMHCNYAEQGQTLDEMCALASRLGFNGVEFRRKRKGDTTDRYLAEVAAAVEKHRIGHVLFGGSIDFMSGDPGSRQRELDEAIGFFRLAAERFQLTVCNTFTGSLVADGIDYYEFERHGSAIGSEAQWEAAIEGFRALGDLASELGFRLAFETHNGYLHDLPGPTRRLIDAVAKPSVGANLDYGNIVLHPEGGSLDAAVGTLSGTIYLLHLKNVLIIPNRRHHQWIGCRLGDGVINHRQLLRLIKAEGFQGPIVVEAPFAGDREAFARVDLAYLRELMAEMG